MEPTLLGSSVTVTSALVKAAEKGDLERVRGLLNSGEPLDEALVTAVIYGRLEVVRLLLDHGAAPNHQHGYGRTALFYAVTNGLPMVNLLLSRGADIHPRESTGSDVLHHYLIDRGPGSRLGTADLAMVRRLLDAGIDVRARNADKPHLPFACAADDLGIVELLLASGADPNAKGVLWEAMKSRRSGGVLALLVDGGIDANARCTNAAADTTILMEVCSRGDLASAQKLIGRGADVNARGRGTPLSRAEESGNQVLVDLLLEHGARPGMPAMSAGVAKALEVAEREARARPGDRQARVAWAEALLQASFRAAAASEFGAVGMPSPRPSPPRGEGERDGWVFTDFVPRQEGVAQAISDARFPGARVTDGVTVLPLVITLGAPCTSCDEKGEQVCTLCNGSGAYMSMLDPDHDVDCSPRQRCSTCRGLKFAVTGKRLGKGSCAHPKMEEEMKLGSFSFRRCQTCGLAALYGNVSGRDFSPYSTDFACGVCGRFACSCDFTRA